ncbi:MAG: L-threonylcarbamoyladenylate synthase [Bacteroidota bacterium]
MDEAIKKSLEILNSGGLLLYPTDTVWGIGCDASNENAVRKIYELKKRDDSKALVCLVNGLTMLKDYIPEVSDNVLEVLKHSEKPTTVIYNNPVGMAQNLIASDNTIAIRIAIHEFCEKLIAEFGKPIVSTSANISGEATPKSFTEISKPILKGVDYIVNLQKEKIATKASTIIRVEVDGNITIIRE